MSARPLTRRAALVASWHHRALRSNTCTECGFPFPCRTRTALIGETS